MKHSTEDAYHALREAGMPDIPNDTRLVEVRESGTEVHHECDWRYSRVSPTNEPSIHARDILTMHALRWFLPWVISLDSDSARLPKVLFDEYDGWQVEMQEWARNGDAPYWYVAGSEGDLLDAIVEAVEGTA